MSEKIISVDFLKNIFKIALPLIIQFVATSALNFIDVIMVGQLGEIQVAAVGMCNQIFYIFILCSVGIATGAGVFVSQLWGARKLQLIPQYQGIALCLNLAVAFIFISATFFFPETLLQLFLKDKLAIEYGTQYLFIIFPTYICFGICIVYYQILISTGLVKYSLIPGMISVFLNTFLNYCLILGNFGFPALGVNGAAIATLIARLVELTITLLLCYGKRFIAAAKISELVNWKLKLFKNFFKVAGPVMLHNLFWVVGVSVYSMIYGQLGMTAFAAFNIVVSIERIPSMLFSAFGQSGAVLIGNSIGAGKEAHAMNQTKGLFILIGIASFLIACIFIFCRPIFISMYNIKIETIGYVSNILLVMAGIICVKSFNIILYSGVLVGGGDTFFSMKTDVSVVWLVGIPCALLGAFVFRLPIHLVILFTSFEEIIKCILAIMRFVSKKWIKNLSKQSDDSNSSIEGVAAIEPLS